MTIRFKGIVHILLDLVVFVLQKKRRLRKNGAKEKNMERNAWDSPMFCAGIWADAGDESDGVCDGSRRWQVGDYSL